MNEGAGSQNAPRKRGAGRSPVIDLAAAGLATQLSAPALLHGLRGNLHNVALLAELLQREADGAQDAEALRASGQKRATSIRSEIVSMQARIRMLETLSGRRDSPHESTCDLPAELEAVLRLTRMEAARRGVTVRTAILPGPVLIACGPQAFQQVVLTCSMFALRSSPQGANVLVTADRNNDDASVEFACDVPVAGATDIEHTANLDLLAALATAAGAKLFSNPALRVVFTVVPH